YSDRIYCVYRYVFFFSSRRRHTRSYGDWSSDVCSSDLISKQRHAKHSTASSRSGYKRNCSTHTSDIEPATAAVLNYKPVYSANRSEERRVGKECRSRWSQDN